MSHVQLTPGRLPPLKPAPAHRARETTKAAVPTDAATGEPRRHDAGVASWSSQTRRSAPADAPRTPLPPRPGLEGDWGGKETTPRPRSRAGRSPSDTESDTESDAEGHRPGPGRRSACSDAPRHGAALPSPASLACSGGAGMDGDRWGDVARGGISPIEVEPAAPPMTQLAAGLAPGPRGAHRRPGRGLPRRPTPQPARRPLALHLTVTRPLGVSWAGRGETRPLRHRSWGRRPSRRTEAVDGRPVPTVTPCGPRGGRFATPLGAPTSAALRAHGACTPRPRRRRGGRSSREPAPGGRHGHRARPPGLGAQEPPRTSQRRS